MSASIIAIVPAAGVGARASRPGHEAVPKQYRPLSGQPMLRHAVSALLADDLRGAQAKGLGAKAEALGIDERIVRAERDEADGRRMVLHLTADGEVALREARELFEREYLLAQPDVSLWSTDASYKAARFGMDWINHLLRRHGTR